MRLQKCVVHHYITETPHRPKILAEKICPPPPCPNRVNWSTKNWGDTSYPPTPLPSLAPTALRWGWLGMNGQTCIIRRDLEFWWKFFEKDSDEFWHKKIDFESQNLALSSFWHPHYTNSQNSIICLQKFQSRQFLQYTVRAPL